MLPAILLLLLFQLAGQVVVTALALPLPGPVLGMAFIFALLVWRPGLVPKVAPGADGLLQVLGLFFVPAGVGVMGHFGLLAREWLPIVVALVLSTALGMVATGIVLERLLRRADRGGEPRRD